MLGRVSSRDQWVVRDLRGPSVFNQDTKQVTIRIGINGEGEMPSSWSLRDGEEFVQAAGHAEEGILNSLAPNEHAIFGATTINFCNATWFPLVNIRGMTLSGGFGHQSHNSAFRLFWLSEEDWAQEVTAVEGLSDPTDAELMVLCAAAAERGMGFCRVLGSAEQQEWLDSALEAVWSAAAGQAVADECADLLDALVLEDDEGGEEDPTASPGFFSDQSIGLVGEALAVSMRPSAEKVESVLRTVRTLLSMADFTLSGAKPVIVRAGETPPAGPLVRREQDARLEVLAVLARDRCDAGGRKRPRPDVLTEVREATRAFVTEVTPALEEFAEAKNWL